MMFAPLVTVETENSWNTYSVNKQGWLRQSLQWQQALATGSRRLLDITEPERLLQVADQVPRIPPQIWSYTNGEEGYPQPQTSAGATFGPGNYAPIWQEVPAPTDDPAMINFDLLSDPVLQRLYHGMWDTSLPVFSNVMNVSFLFGASKVSRQGDAPMDHPHSVLFSPVYPNFQVKPGQNFSGLIAVIFSWDKYLMNLLPSGVADILIVLQNSCGGVYSYQVNSSQVLYVGEGDHHDSAYNGMMVNAAFSPFLQYNRSSDFVSGDYCEYNFLIYPSGSLRAQYKTMRPTLFTMIVVVVFAFTVGAFLYYDALVQYRQKMVMATAKRTDAVVSALFPSGFRDRILQEAEDMAEKDVKNKASKRSSIDGTKGKLKAFLGYEGQAEAKQCAESPFSSKPIAELFPNVTVMFADVAGFTAWSSVREPSQVFTLLEVRRPFSSSY